MHVTDDDTMTARLTWSSDLVGEVTPAGHAVTFHYDIEGKHCQDATRGKAPGSSGTVCAAGSQKMFPGIPGIRRPWRSRWRRGDMQE